MLDITRQKIYEQRRGRNYRQIDTETKTLVMNAFRANNEVYGFRKIHVFLTKNQSNIALWRVSKTYETLDLRARKNRSQKKYHHSRGGTNTSTINLTNHNFKADHINQKWFIDVSLIRLENNEHLAVCVFTDSYANQVVDWKLSYTSDVDLTIGALQAAIDAYGVPEIVHAYHGSSFLDKPFITWLKKYYKIKQSNSRVGNSLDNRPIEHFFSVY